MDIWLDMDEIETFRADPDGYTARNFGLTREEYFEWLDTGGWPLCSAITKDGRCRRRTSHQLDAFEWKLAHRKHLCKIHARQERERTAELFPCEAVRA